MLKRRRVGRRNRKARIPQRAYSPKTVALAKKAGIPIGPNAQRVVQAHAPALQAAQAFASILSKRSKEWYNRHDLLGEKVGWALLVSARDAANIVRGLKKVKRLTTTCKPFARGAPSTAASSRVLRPGPSGMRDTAIQSAANVARDTYSDFYAGYNLLAAAAWNKRKNARFKKLSSQLDRQESTLRMVAATFNDLMDNLRDLESWIDSERAKTKATRLRRS